MLLQMRTFARSWIAYLLLFILTVAFAIWGIKDVFRNVGAQNVAEVSGKAITPPQLTRELDLTLQGQRQQGQGNMTQEEAIAQGLHMRLLEGMIGRLAFYAYAERLGVAASDAQVAEGIRAIPAVVNPVTGRFDQTAYASFLERLHYSRGEFEQDMRENMTRQMLAQALVNGVRAPQSYGALLYSYGAETRVISVAEAPAASVGAIPPPTQQQLQSFWQDNQENLRVPEFRHLTLIYARAADFVARVNVSEQQLREEFEQRRASMSQPERRSYDRIVAQNQAQANEAAQRLNRGETAQAVAAAMHLQTTSGANEARTDVPDARIAEAIFSMAARAPARVVQGQLTPWAVVRVTAITPAVEPSFEASRDQIRQAIANDQAGELLNTAVSAYEDARAGGAPAAQAARQNGLTVVDLPAVEAQGRDANGAAIEALSGQRELLQTAFATPEGEASDFVPLQDADVVVAVDGITPARVRPLAEVRDQLTQAWTARERGRRLREKGEQFVASLHGGNFAAAARAQHFNLVVPSQAVSRQQAGQIPSRGLPEQIFAAHEGDVLSGVRTDGASVLVAIVEHINHADAAANPQQVEAARAQMQESLTQSFGQAMQDQVVADAHPRRNEELIRRLFTTTAADQDNQ